MGKSSKLIKAFLDSVRGLKSSQKEKSGSLNHGNAGLTCNHPGTDDGDYNRVDVKKEKRRWRSFGKSASINRSSDTALLMQPGAVHREHQHVAFDEELPDQVNLGCSDLYTKSRGAAVADCYTDISCIIVDEKLPLAKLNSDTLKNAAATGNKEINSVGALMCREGELTVDKMLDKSTVFLASNRLHWAAARIQTAFRGYLARRAFRALKGLVRLQALARGRRVRKQAAATLRCVHALVRVQARIRAHQVRISEQGQAVQRRLHIARVKRQLQQQHGQQQQQAAAAATAASPAKPSMVIDPQHEWDCSPATTEQLQAKIQYRQVAAMKRERALAYAFSEQLRRCVPKGSTPFVIDCSSKSDKDNQWGWSWLERWMAAKPWQRGSFNPGLAREHVSVMNVMDETANTINNNHIKPADHHLHHYHDITDESAKISPYHHQQYHVDKNLFINKDQDHAVYIKKRSLSIPEIMLNNIDSLLSQLNDQPASAIHTNSHKNASPIRSTSTFSNDATNLAANPSSPAANSNHRINRPAVYNCVQRSPTSHRQATGSNNIIKKQLPCNNSGQDHMNIRSRGTSQLAVDAINDSHAERKAGLGCNYDHHNDSMNDQAAGKQNGMMISTAAMATTPPTTPPNKVANYNHGTAAKASSFNPWKAMATLSDKASLIEQQSHHSEPGLVINDINRIRAAHNYGDSVKATAMQQLPSYMQSTHSAKAKARAAATVSPGGSQSNAATRSTSPAGQSTPAAKSPSMHLTSPKAKNNLSNASVINGVSPPPKRRNSISSTHSISTAAPVQPTYIASSNRANNNLINTARIADSDHHHHHQRLISHVATQSSRGFSSSATSNRLVEMEVV